MTGFQTDLLLRLNHNTGVFTTDAPLIWIDPSGHEHIVPVSAETDGMSIPWFLEWLFPSAIKWFPAVMHDYFYRVLRPGRRWADDLFFHAMLSVPVGMKDAPTLIRQFQQKRFRADWVFRCWLAWFGLRLFGWYAYKQNRNPLP